MRKKRLRVEIRRWDTFYVIIVAVNFIVGNEFVNVDPVSLQCKNNYSSIK